jgi:hypothetical protein
MRIRIRNTALNNIGIFNSSSVIKLMDPFSGGCASLQKVKLYMARTSKICKSVIIFRFSVWNRNYYHSFKDKEVLKVSYAAIITSSITPDFVVINGCRA